MESVSHRQHSMVPSSKHSIHHPLARHHHPLNRHRSTAATKNQGQLKKEREGNSAKNRQPRRHSRNLGTDPGKCAGSSRVSDRGSLFVRPMRACCLVVFVERRESEIA